MPVDYSSFLARKLSYTHPSGICVDEVHARLFHFQRDIVRLSLRRGKSAIFADTGLGKTAMQLAWSEQVIRATDRPVLILTPLAVAAQTVREAERMGLGAVYVKEPTDIPRHDCEPVPCIYITNYDRLHKFNPAWFNGIVLDESSIVKDHTSATRNQLIEAFSATPYKLCCTATPSPNDFTELGNHAEFLGVMKRTEMLSKFFYHDGGSVRDWHLKGHAKDAFWRWVASWAIMVKRPSDLGYDDAGYALPPLNIQEHIIELDVEVAREKQADDIKKGKRRTKQISLFTEQVSTLNDRRWARKVSIEDRVKLAAEIVSAEPNESWLVWVDLNDEGDRVEQELRKLIPGFVQIAGSDSAEFKESTMLGFCKGEPLSIVTKTSIAGYGMNWQHCARQIFIGLNDSFEKFYQGIRRSWRFGQSRPVDVHVIITDAEKPVLANIKRKQAEAEEMGRAMVRFVRQAMGDSVAVDERRGYEHTSEIVVPEWLREAM